MVCGLVVPVRSPVQPGEDHAVARSGRRGHGEQCPVGEAAMAKRAGLQISHRTAIIFRIGVTDIHRSERNGDVFDAEETESRDCCGSGSRHRSNCFRSEDTLVVTGALEPGCADGVVWTRRTRRRRLVLRMTLAAGARECHYRQWHTWGRNCRGIQPGDGFSRSWSFSGKVVDAPYAPNLSDWIRDASGFAPWG